MSVELIEGFDALTAAQLYRRYASNANISNVTGRYGVFSALYISGVGDVVFPLTARSEYYFGVDILLTVPWYSGQDFIRIIGTNGSTIAAINPIPNTTQLTLSYAGGSASSPAGAYTSAQWFSLQVHLIVNATTGRYTAKTDNYGGVIVDQNNVNTGSINIASINFHFGSPGGVGNAVGYDNFWVFNTLGSHSNTWPLGPMIVQPHFPTSDGSHTDFTTSTGGGTHYTQVDELPADDDTTYNYASTPGNQDSYGISPLVGVTGLAGFSQIHGMRLSQTIRKEDLPVKNSHITLTSGGTTVEGPDGAPYQSFYMVNSYYVNDDPNTSAQWTVDGVNNIQIGAKVIT